jgi:hypothetical protein
MPLYTFLHNLLNVLVEIAGRKELKKKYFEPMMTSRWSEHVLNKLTLKNIKLNII